MRRKTRALLWAIVLPLILGGCGTLLGPQVSYQGRLTDAGGAPLNGTYGFSFGLYNVASGGSPLYTETDTLTVEDGLFDTTVGPDAFVAGLLPEDLAQPLWLEVTIGDGVITETLTPRQRLHGAPYAFTLMPGSVISSTMPAALYEPSGVRGVLAVINPFDGDVGSPALPALRLVGETGLELASPTADDGTIFSDQSVSGSDLFLHSQDNIQLYLDEDDNELGDFFIVGNDGNSCRVTDTGNLSCTGTKSAAVTVGDEQRLMYAIESPEVWFEDFGGGTLSGGAAEVTLDPDFAATVNLTDYRVFVTPLGDCAGLYVTNKTATGFEVRELGGGTSEIGFDYRIVARRLGFEDQRMERNASPSSGLEAPGQ